MFDVIVVGAGINGLWTAYTSSKAGKKTLLVEQFPMPHSRGSSHGQTRIIRYGYPQPHHARMMPHAFKCWRELEETAHCKLIETVGMLNICKNDDPRLTSMIQNYEILNIDHEVLDPEEIQRRFPGVNLEAGTTYLYEPEGGILKAEKARLVLQNEITKLGGKIVDGCPVNFIEPISDTSVTVRTDKGFFTGKSLILTCGPWANKILSKVGITVPVTPIRVQVHYWAESSDSQLYVSHRFPIVIKYLEQDVYSIPSIEYPGLMKVCMHTGVACDPDKRDAFERKQREEELFKLLKKGTAATFSNLQSEPSITESCIYTLSHDHDNIIDKHPKHSNIAFAAGFSGSGFKTSPTVARILLNMIEGKQNTKDVEKWSMERFSKKSRL